MAMLPQPGRPESEEGESRPYYPDSPTPFYERPRRKFSTETRILAYAVVGGTLLAIFFSLLNTIFFLLSNPEGVFVDRAMFQTSRGFFSLFVSMFSGYAPLLIVTAAIAAAAEHIIRRASANASQNNRALIDALKELDRNPASRPGDRREIVDPMLKNLNLEIDPRKPIE
jgi:hypothetical protein